MIAPDLQVISVADALPATRNLAEMASVLSVSAFMDLLDRYVRKSELLVQYAVALSGVPCMN
jgi:hypothetical protein